MKKMTLFALLLGGLLLATNAAHADPDSPQTPTAIDSNLHVQAPAAGVAERAG
jgi:hypothetical protein